MIKKSVFNNIKSQNGFSGADIIISVTVIVITIAVISMIYVNTTLEGRNITRTAGATRIATNILENIEKISYEEFIQHFNEEEITIHGGNNEKIFSTKIPKGYTVCIKAMNNYGSRENIEEQFDLVRDIFVTVEFIVGDRTEKIDFQTVKKMELIEEINRPNTEFFANSKMNCYPVKYSISANSYIKINEEDILWYNYSNKEWATVIVSRKEEKDLFDINGKFLGTLDSDIQSANYTVRYVWIPRFFRKINSDGIYEFYSFAYLATGNNKIVSKTMKSKAETEFNYNTFEEIASLEGVDTDTTNFDNQSGKWVIVENNGITSDFDANLLNNSKYGPFIIY